jgi:hypothetical protein
MTKLPSELKHDTILEAIFELRPEPEPPKAVFDEIKSGADIAENYPEIEVIEVPLFRKMLFQFNKPVKLEFS